MKSGYYEKHLSVIVALLVCTTVFLWTWKSGLILGSHSLFEFTQAIVDSVPVAGGELKEIRNEETNDHEIHDGEILERIEGRQNNHTLTNSGLEKNGTEEAINLGSHEALDEKGDENEETTNGIKSGITGSDEGFSNRSEVVKDQLCDYGKGKWVVDKNQTLYSGHHCKQWLRSPWACRLTRRPDFSYENLRWHPKDCALEPFDGAKFLKRLQNKTLAIVGDSLGKQQFQSLMCMITGGGDHNDDNIISVSKEFGGSQALRFTATNTALVNHWSTTLCDVRAVNKSNPNTTYALHLDRPTSFLTKNIHKIDVLVLNTGHHWGPYKFHENRWVAHVNGVPIWPNSQNETLFINKARNTTIHNIIGWANEQLARYPGLRVFYRTFSPRHFYGGDWNTGGKCDKTTMEWVGKEIDGDDTTIKDEVAESAVAGTKVRLLDIMRLTSVRDEAHISRYRGSHVTDVPDCSHWCLPGVPDTWNEILNAQLQL